MNNSREILEKVWESKSEDVKEKLSPYKEIIFAFATNYLEELKKVIHK